MNTVPYPESARSVVLSNPKHPFTPAHDVKVVLDAFRKVPSGAILDIGCNQGWSTRELSLAFPDRLIMAMDWPPASATMDPWQRGEAPQWDRVCEQARDLPNVLTVLADSRKLQSSWFPNVTCIFIDADHSYEGVKRDTEFAMRVVGSLPSGTSWSIAWHDCYDPPARKDIPHWVGVKRYLTENVPGAVQIADSWVAVLHS